MLEPHLDSSQHQEPTQILREKTARDLDDLSDTTDTGHEQIRDQSQRDLLQEQQDALKPVPEHRAPEPGTPHFRWFPR